MKTIVLCLLVNLTWAANAQGSPEPVDPLRDGARARIQSQRRQAESQFEKQEIECYQKFAVNDCLRQARAVHRDVMADLRRQELSLNAAEAKRKGSEQIQRIDARSSPQALRDEAERLAQAQADQQERQRRFDEKASAKAAAAIDAPARRKEAEEQQLSNEQTKSDRAARAAAAPLEKSRNDARQVEAQQRDVQRQKRLAEQKKPQTGSLPSPP
jgi:colicin import membrane protein